MQLKDLPPIQFLPAFEAAGRHGSFKAAAAELHVTPSAISQEIKVLEEALGEPLFERRGRAVVLTEGGASYLREVQQALATISSATQRYRRRREARVLRLSTVDFVANEFLLSRLASFRERFPGLELSVETTNRLVDFATTDIDAAIRVSGGKWPGVVSHVLGDAWVAPVCDRRTALAIRGVEQLRSHPLLEVRGQERRGWTPFMRRHGIHEPLQLLYFDGYFETLRAAEQGRGVAFGVFPLTTEWVTSARLSIPLPIRMRLVASISLSHRELDPMRQTYALLTQWLREHYAALPSLPEGRLIDGSPRKAKARGKARTERA